MGLYNNGIHGDQTLIEHWNGTAWKVVPSPSPGGGRFDGLSGVAATSAGNAWAVGSYSNGTAKVTLTEHWNGTAWKHVPSPNPAVYDDINLFGVAATSARNAWAVGTYVNNRTDVSRMLIEHWNGTAWKRVPSPIPGSADNRLSGVAATSAGNVWAVGSYGTDPAVQTLALHCC